MSGVFDSTRRAMQDMLGTFTQNAPRTQIESRSDARARNDSRTMASNTARNQTLSAPIFARKMGTALTDTRKNKNLAQFMSNNGLRSAGAIAGTRGGLPSLDALNQAAGQGRYALRSLSEMMNGAGAGTDPFTAPGGGGAMGNPTGEGWDAVNQWNGLIEQAIARVAREKGITVPGNVVKAVMKLESGGVNTGCNAWGYCGLMQTGPGSWIDNFDSGYNSTPEGNIYYGVQELANWYNAVGTGDWIDGAAAYFSGWNYDNPGVSDGYGTTVGQYRQIIQQNLQALGGAGGSMFGGGAGGQFGGGSGAGASVLQSMFPSGNPGFDFGVSSGNGLYGYGTAYGLNGSQHTGMDIPQPLGSPLYAPGNGVVVCVGCWRNDHITGGVGRIEIEMPDGARILYDHTYSSNVQVGQRVSAGTLLGTSGGMYSPHTHLEVRVPDSSQSSGYRLVDPAAYFGGGAGFAPQGGAGGSGGGSGNWALDFLMGR